MGRFLLFIGAILLFGCHDPKPDYPIPTKNEINEVLKSVISQQKIVVHFLSTGRVVNGTDSIFKYNTLDSTALTINLKKLIATEGRGSEKMVGINYLLDLKKKYYFTRADVPYLYFQNRILNGIKIGKAAAAKSKFTNDKWLHTEWKNRHIVHPFYNLSIPIFSLNQQQAYVQLDVYFAFNLAQGYEFILRKINGKWKIVSQSNTWIT